MQATPTYGSIKLHTSQIDLQGGSRVDPSDPMLSPSTPRPERIYCYHRVAIAIFGAVVFVCAVGGKSVNYIYLNSPLYSMITSLAIGSSAATILKLFLPSFPEKAMDEISMLTAFWLFEGLTQLEWNAPVSPSWIKRAWEEGIFTALGVQLSFIVTCQIINLLKVSASVFQKDATPVRRPMLEGDTRNFYHVLATQLPHYALMSLQFLSIWKHSEFIQNLALFFGGRAIGTVLTQLPLEKIQAQRSKIIAQMNTTGAFPEMKLLHITIITYRLAPVALPLVLAVVGVWNRWYTSLALGIGTAAMNLIARDIFCYERDYRCNSAAKERTLLQEAGYKLLPLPEHIFTKRDDEEEISTSRRNLDLIKGGLTLTAAGSVFAWMLYWWYHPPVTEDSPNPLNDRMQVLSAFVASVGCLVSSVFYAYGSEEVQNRLLNSAYFMLENLGDYLAPLSILLLQGYQDTGGLDLSISIPMWTLLGILLIVPMVWKSKQGAQTVDAADFIFLYVSTITMIRFAQRDLIG